MTHPKIRDISATLVGKSRAAPSHLQFPQDQLLHRTYSMSSAVAVLHREKHAVAHVVAVTLQDFRALNIVNMRDRDMCYSQFPSKDIEDDDDE